MRSIQAMRGLAAASVLMFHTLDSFVVGAAGVDIFFIVSGYIMGKTALGSHPANFIAKRLARIAPLYWIVTLLFCSLAQVGILRNFTFNSEELLKSLLFIPYTNKDGKIWPLVVAGWTLNIEMLFYSLFYLGLLAKKALLFASVSIISLVLIGTITDTSSAILKTYTSPLLLEFAAGLWLATYRSKGNASVGMLLMAVGMIMFAAVSPFDWFEGASRLWAWGLPSALVVGGALEIENANMWPDRMYPLERLGDISYSLYLSHGLIVAAVHRFFEWQPLQALLALTLSVAGAFLVYHFIEYPITRKLNSIIKAKMSY